jgi:hypothetical protein
MDRHNGHGCNKRRLEGYGEGGRWQEGERWQQQKVVEYR